MGYGSALHGAHQDTDFHSVLHTFKVPNTVHVYIYTVLNGPVYGGRSV